MRTILSSCFIIMVLASAIAFAENNPGIEKKDAAICIIPKPLSLKKDDGTFLVTKSTSVYVSGSSNELHNIAAQISARLRAATGFPIPVSPLTTRRNVEDAIIVSLVNDADLGPEGYRLSVAKKSVRIEGLGASGVFYGAQTLYQLMPVEIENKQLSPGVAWSIPCVRIEDKPRFSWRGMHLDVGRHFFSKDSVKRYIDLMASYKMNMFHWHLTEDQGWRIEIKKYPRLTTVGGWRRETMFNGTPHGGFYTQDDVREIVQYAKERFITVVPEIEMPGHSMAALAAYPELSCSGGPFKVGTEWGVLNDVYCAGNEKTFRFMEDVIDEVVALFPGTFFHIGGDECPKLRWSNCKRCQDRIVAEGLKNEEELQSYFVKRIEEMLNARGKRLVGWDEILEGGLAPNATVMSWRGIKGGIEAAKTGHDVVMTPTSHCYFDYYQGTVGEPLAIGGYLPIDTVYSYEPIPDELTGQEANHVLGAQGNVWTEYMPNFRQVEYMAATRMIALSEVVWSAKAQRNFKDFLQRLEPQYRRLAISDVNHRVPTPLGVGGRQVIVGDTVAVITSPIPAATIYYTLDGTDPTPTSSRYTAPLPIKGDRTLKAALQLPGSKMSTTITTEFFLIDPNVNGVRYDYYEGEWDLLPDMKTLSPRKSGVIYDIGLNEKSGRMRNFGFAFSCFVSLPADGEYTFTLASDDGSKLYFDNRELINNDGLHAWNEVNAKVAVKQGKHPLEVQYFQRGGGYDLKIFLEGPGIPKQQMSPRMLSVR
ncbi:MAG: family 20 glycosylhydrolase [Ignavibacteria bacterium]|nr:family 20 glycosylhydrolase [Ignavibacteria bacterium]